MFVLLREFSAKGKHYVHSMLYKEAKNAVNTSVLGMLAKSIDACDNYCFAPRPCAVCCTWMLVTRCLAPRPCTVCCTKSKNAVNTSVLGMIAKGSDMNTKPSTPSSLLGRFPTTPNLASWCAN